MKLGYRNQKRTLKHWLILRKELPFWNVLDWTERIPQFPTSLQQWKTRPRSCPVLILLKGGKWQPSHYIDDMRKQLTVPAVFSTLHRWQRPNSVQRRNKWNHSLSYFHWGRGNGALSILLGEKTYFLDLPCTGNFITTEFQSPLVFLNEDYWKISLLFVVILPSIQGRTLSFIQS